MIIFLVFRFISGSLNPTDTLLTRINSCLTRSRYSVSTPCRIAQFMSAATLKGKAADYWRKNEQERCKGAEWRARRKGIKSERTEGARRERWPGVRSDVLQEGMFSASGGHSNSWPPWRSPAGRQRLVHSFTRFYRDLLLWWYLHGSGTALPTRKYFSWFF